MPRFSGGTKTPSRVESMTRPPTVMVPALSDSRPEIMRKVVVLPQPEGPSRQVNEPSGISRSRSSTAGGPDP